MPRLAPLDLNKLTPDQKQVADAILMLVKNDYITGDTVTIDGGLTMRIA